MVWRGVLLAVLMMGLSGCTDCRPLLDLKYCLEGQRACDPDPDDVRTWGLRDAQTWPDVDAAMDALLLGKHEHARWSEERAAAFWQHFGVDPEAEVPELYFERDGEGPFRLRILTC